MELFYDKYTTKDETMYRLPMKVNIKEFWPEELRYRMEKAHSLPLHSYDGHKYFYNATEEYINAADVITEMARNASDTSVFAELTHGSIAEEAFYSSVIEGAYSTREKAHALIDSQREPIDKDERMILNNYKALQFVSDNLDSPVSHELILRIGEMLTDGTLEEGVTAGYRDDIVYVKSRFGEIIYTAPPADCVRPMMDQLIAYMNDKHVHPIEKAVVSHVYFVTIHPFFDGNGRTARALTYMILLKSGYDFFRLVPISGILAEKRGQYYKALQASQDRENGCDYTYFVNFYTELLAETLESVKKRIAAMDKYRRVKEKLNPDSEGRLIKGACWLATEDIESITTEKWRKKFAVSFETARKDLNTLEEKGFLKKRTEGRKAFFDI